MAEHRGLLFQALLSLYPSLQHVVTLMSMMVRLVMMEMHRVVMDAVLLVGSKFAAMEFSQHLKVKLAMMVIYGMVMDAINSVKLKCTLPKPLQ